MKKWLAISVLILVFIFICALFWYSEWRYTLPTPVPATYHTINTGTYVDLTDAAFSFPSNKPVFLHFFNPDCPCSKFNVPHFKTLVTAYADKINFAVIVMTRDKRCTADQVKKKYGLTVPVLLDTALARACGVYSTPQAVLLDNQHALYYRGNYNKSRYCTNSKSNYAQMAIDSLLAFHAHPEFTRQALTAYGCTLPTCKK
jgi:thioredoxin-related protein